MKLQKIVSRLQELHPKEIDLSLDRIQNLCKKLGNPQDKIKAISIVGTNGKYSTIQALYTILKEAKLKCNIYTSPHVKKINERFIFNNQELNDDELADRMRLIRNHAEAVVEDKGVTSLNNMIGHNFRLGEIECAIGIEQLKKLPSDNNHRRELSKIYREKLSDIEGLDIPYKNNCGTSSYHIFPVLLDKDIDRQNFMKHLKDKGIQTSIHYPPIHQFQFHRRNAGNKENILPLTEEIGKREVSLPLYPSMEDEDVKYVCEIAIEYLIK